MSGGFLGGPVGFDTISKGRTALTVLDHAMKTYCVEGVVKKKEFFPAPPTVRCRRDPVTNIIFLLGAACAFGASEEENENSNQLRRLVKTEH